LLRADSQDPQGAVIASIPGSVHRRLIGETGLTNNHLALLLADVDGS
jgi:hypothetical protein